MTDMDRIRIIEGKKGNREPGQDPECKVIFNGYKGMLMYHRDERQVILMDPKVVRLSCCPEVRHSKYKELGLMPPYDPEVTRMYEFSDMTVFLYYDIYIGKE